MNTDGTCGIEDPHSPRTCAYGIGHSGAHSWEARPAGFHISGGVTADEARARAAAGSPAAEALEQLTEEDWLVSK